VPAAETIWTAFSLLWTFFQTFNGIIHLQINWSSRALVRPPGGNAYIGLFAMAAQMWTAKIRERWMARVVSVDERVVLVGARWCLIRIRRVGWSAPSILVQLHSVVLIRRR
jgi:hypothetical protein